jgi:tRNA pseudouridine38/39 synthase
MIFKSFQLITQLLDIEKVPARPQYSFANELPLCLFDCGYPEGDLDWIYDPAILNEVMIDLQKMWASSN